jgi:putative CocE/NonD family hydrolase
MAASMRWWASVAAVLVVAMAGTQGVGQAPPGAVPTAKELYNKTEVMIPMRDGVKLFTAIYTPKDTASKHPILLNRTPYSIAPYGPNNFPSRVGPSSQFMTSGYIVVNQDVRGRVKSEGVFDHMRPHNPNKRSPQDIDESTDTYDTIDWLVKNVENNNGKVGMWGISYPGFYCAAGMIDAHPALVAVSPQAPIADWWYDDFRHHGAFFLAHAFNFMRAFGRDPQSSVPIFRHPVPDGYESFLRMGPLKDVDAKLFHGSVPYWNELLKHCNYDEYWQARNILPHLKKTAPAVMTVGGWFDAEDLYGPLQIYRHNEKNNPGKFNVLVMGPWDHGGWSRGPGNRLGGVSFGSDTAAFYRANIEFPFFNHFLKGEGDHKLPEAYVFETGVNAWRQFAVWPPQETQAAAYYLHPKGMLASSAPGGAGGADEFVSDPQKPVPFTEAMAQGMTREYMTDDQRFASRRPDVLVYQTPILTENVTLAGPLTAELWVSTTGTDADWVVKLVDVFPDDAPTDFDAPRNARPMAGYQMMVRSEVLRGRFRNNPSKPEPFVPDQPTLVRIELQDVLHTFKKGHRIQVQVQSSWFPLVDRNPQKYVPNVAEANEADFIKATHRVHVGGDKPSVLRVGVLPK